MGTAENQGQSGTFPRILPRDRQRVDTGLSRQRAIARLLICLLGIVFLTAIGFGAADRLKPANLTIPGTENAAGERLREANFGGTFSYAALLQGPRKDVDQVGAAMVANLGGRPGFSVSSPWDGNVGVANQLRPKSNAAMILITRDSTGVKDLEPLSAETAELIRKLGKSDKVKLSLTGASMFGQALKSEGIEGIKKAEMIAAPLLIIVLLLVFRTPLAAAIPLIMGAATVTSSNGVIFILTFFRDIDPAVLQVASILGLALGVDYALLMVSRYREERANGAMPGDAAHSARQSAGRTVIFAGVTVIAVMLLAFALVPGQFLTSMVLGVIIAAMLSMSFAVIGLPAALVLCDKSLERWRIPSLSGRAGGDGAKWLAPARFALKHPALVLFPTLLLVALPALPISSFKTGPPDVRQLPASNQVRKDFESVAKVMGAGWATPYEIIVQSVNGPITEARALRGAVATQRRLSGIEGVRDVLGPLALVSAGKQLMSTKDLLADSQNQGVVAKAKLRAAYKSLGDARAGVIQLQSGIKQGAAASAQLSEGAGAIADGASKFSGPLANFGAGANQIKNAIPAVAEYAKYLKSNASKFDAQTAAQAREISKLADQLGPLEALAGQMPSVLRAAANSSSTVSSRLQEVNGQLQSAISALDGITIDESDPNYANVQAARSALKGAAATAAGAGAATAGGASSALGASASELNRIASTFESGTDPIHALVKGVRSLEAGAKELRNATGTAREGSIRTIDKAEQVIRKSSAQLNGFVDTAQQGVSALVNGSRAVQNGNAQLATGLDGGAKGVGQLGNGLRKGQTEVAKTSKSLDKPLSALEAFAKQSPGVFMSPWALPAVLDGMPKAKRDAIASTVSLQKGSMATRILVIPQNGPDDPNNSAMVGSFKRNTAHLRETGRYDAAVTGAGGVLSDYSSAMEARLPALVIGIVLICVLALSIVFRAFLLAVIAVALNLLTVAATFGVLTFLLKLPSHPLGDAMYIDGTQVAIIYSVIFALSIDYQVFLLSRMREYRDAGHTTHNSIEFGLNSTAGVVTGAAVTMLAVFVAAAATDLSTLRQLGIGLTVAIILDATVVRLILLPAALKFCGDSIWWMPKAIEKRLPTIQH